MEKLNLTIIVDTKDGCNGGQCPTVYKSDEGRIFVQGNVVKEHLNVQIPKDEAIVEIPRALLEKLVKEGF